MKGWVNPTLLLSLSILSAPQRIAGNNISDWLFERFLRVFYYHENPNDFLRFICVFEKSLSERCPNFRLIIFVFIVWITPVTKEGYFNSVFCQSCIFVSPANNRSILQVIAVIITSCQ